MSHVHNINSNFFSIYKFTGCLQAPANWTTTPSSQSSHHAIVSFFLFCSPLFCFLFFNIQIVSDYYLTSPTKNSIRQGEGAVVGRPMMLILVGFEPMEEDSSPVEEPPAVDLSYQRQSTIRIQI